jgi:quercetin dioxygenase-like cupin family protein
MSTAVPVVVEQDAGEAWWFGGGLFTFKVTSEQSGGAFLLIEDTAMRGKTTPLHSHPEHDETFYLIEGEILLHIDGSEQVARAGSVAAIPRGVPHAFLVISESARFLGFITPGDASAEAFFRQAGEPAPSRTPPPEGTPLNIEAIIGAGKQTGFMDMLGPPPFKRDAEPSAKLAG